MNTMLLLVAFVDSLLPMRKSVDIILPLIKLASKIPFYKKKWFVVHNQYNRNCQFCLFKDKLILVIHMLIYKL